MDAMYWINKFKHVKFTKQWRTATEFATYVEDLIGKRPKDAGLVISYRDGVVDPTSLRWESRTERFQRGRAEKAAASTQLEAASVVENTDEEDREAEDPEVQTPVVAPPALTETIPAPPAPQIPPVPTAEPEKAPYEERILNLIEHGYPTLVEARALTNTLTDTLLPLLAKVIEAEEHAGFDLLERRILNQNALDTRPSEPRLASRALAYDAVLKVFDRVRVMRDRWMPTAAPPVPVAPAKDPPVVPPAPVAKPVPTAPVKPPAAPPAPVKAAPVAPAPTAPVALLPPAEETVPTKGTLRYEETELALLDVWLPFLRESLRVSKGWDTHGCLLIVSDTKDSSDTANRIKLSFVKALGIPAGAVSLLHTSACTMSRLAELGSIRGVIFVGRSISGRTKFTVKGQSAGAPEVTVHNTGKLLNGARQLNTLLAERAMPTAREPGSLWTSALRSTFRFRKGVLEASPDDIFAGKWLDALGLGSRDAERAKFGVLHASVASGLIASDMGMTPEEIAASRARAEQLLKLMG